jgi:hypothetical protein
VSAVAALLVLVAVVSALAGIGISWASSCCGSSEPADPTAALVGIGVAGAMFVGGAGLWSGRVSRRAVLVSTAALPAVVVAAAPWSLDAAGLGPFVVLGWVGLWRYLARPAPSGWVGQVRAQRASDE